MRDDGHIRSFSHRMNRRASDSRPASETNQNARGANSKCPMPVVQGNCKIARLISSKDICGRSSH
eukprot:2524938-Pyramimonas_sp.AAC.1